MLWARMVAYVTGTVNQELLLRNEYLREENRILRGQIKGRLLLSEGEKATLAEIAQRLGRKALEELAAVAKPDTLLVWYRKLIANKFDGSKVCESRGSPRVDEETERLVVRMAKENPGWGYDRIVGAMANLSHRLSDQAVSLKGAHLPPHCLQLAQVTTRVRRKREGANRLSVPAGDSGHRKPSADVFSLFSLLLLACSEQLAQESPGRNNNGPMDAEAVRRLIGEALGDHAMQQSASPAGACAERPAI